MPMPMPMPSPVSALLVCPRDHAALREELPQQLVCTSCGARFAVTDGIADMIIEHATLADPPTPAEATS